MAKAANPHAGSSFDAFLREEGIFEEVTAHGLKRAIAEQLREQMEALSLKKTELATRMATSRSQLDRVLDPDNLSVQLDTLIRAATAVGKEVEIRLVDRKAQQARKPVEPKRKARRVSAAV